MSDTSKISDVHIDILRFVLKSENPVSVIDIAKHLKVDPKKIDGSKMKLIQAVKHLYDTRKMIPVGRSHFQ